MSTPCDRMKICLGIDLLNKAIELEPTYAPALAHAAWCYEQRNTRAWPSASADDAENCDRAGSPSTCRGQRRCGCGGPAGFVLVMVARDYRAGLDAVRRAVERNPGSGFVNFIAGTALVFGDYPKEALVVLQRAMALGPLDPSFYHVSDGGWMGPALQRSPRTRPWNWPNVRWPSIPNGTRPIGA